MLVLAIESSCDETACAVVEQTADAARPWRVRSSVVASQVEIHREWGGVVPELASRQHLRDICGVVEGALAEAGVSWGDLQAIAVTQGPGLIGSLLVGVAFAKAIAAVHGLPLVGVHHLAGHIESLVLHNGPLPLPAIVLVVSGGHTSLYHLPETGRYLLVGKTRDDAAGEAYDKVAKLLGLGYPGGPIIDRLARTGNDRAVDFPVARMTGADRAAGPRRGVPGPFADALKWRTDFSFSGLKTSVLRHVRRRQEASGWDPASGAPAPDPRSLFTEAEVTDLCASFQRAVVTALLDRTFAAARWFDARSVGIAGGVSANSRLRADAIARGEVAGLPVFVPSLSLTTDNAAMIGAAALRRLERGESDTLDMSADASLAL
ncbi:MAG: tRNA (adenosine(37)-N6)-threonylcarbamoyltransferase complex transferase subunit TsaD [Vicinamibacterales bacterium]|nr:tRNA (adenosine(37)-N6)-threonylcarbamoyltransferase complex transferase subunit TsaD [Vicinamibacterales bacterium]